MTNQLLCEVIVDKPYTDVGVPKQVESELTMFIHASKSRARIIKFWFRSADDAERAQNDFWVYKTQRHPAAQIDRRENYVTFGLNSNAEYVHPPMTNARSETRKRYDYASVVREMIATGETGKTINCELRGNGHFTYPSSKEFERAIKRLGYSGKIHVMRRKDKIFLVREDV